MYDIYMVDTHKSGGGDSPSRNAGNGGPRRGNNTGDDAGGDDNMGRGGDNERHDSAEDDDYNPDDDPKKSPDAIDEHVLDMPLDNVNYEAVCSRLKTTSRRIKNKTRCLQDAEDHLKIWWNELFEAEDALEARLAKIEANNRPSHPRKNLINEMDVVADDSIISRRGWADNLERPPRNRPPHTANHQVGTGRHTPEVTRHQEHHSPRRDDYMSDSRGNMP